MEGQYNGKREGKKERNMKKGEKGKETVEKDYFGKGSVRKGKGKGR